MAPKPGPIRQLWYKWKMLRLPWRKQWLIGFDLQGHTYWEFKDQLHALRNRRIVRPSTFTHHSDVVVPPQWAQWLRHTRYEPPTLSELQSDVQRQARIKLLAAQADARWAAKESALDAPDKQQPVQMLESRDQGRGLRQSNIGEAGREGAPVVNEPVTGGEGAGVTSGVENAGAEAEADVKTGEKTEEGAPTLKKRKVMKREPKDSPWKQAQQGNPGDEWQPQQWAPKGPARRK